MNKHVTVSLWIIDFQFIALICYPYVSFISFSRCRLDLFDWPVNNTCSDYFEIRGEQGVSREYPKICDESDLSEAYNTTSSRVWIHYHSDWPHEGGFTIDYFSTEQLSGPVDQSEICGGVLNGNNTKLSIGWGSARIYCHKFGIIVEISDSPTLQKVPKVYVCVCVCVCVRAHTHTHSGGFRGGAQPARAPLLKHFSINAPPFCTCAPPFETLKKKKKKKKVSDSARLYPGCYLPPPPPDVDGAPKKKKSVWFRPAIPRLLLTPPPPWSRWRSEKKKCRSLKFLDPPLHTHTHTHTHTHVGVGLGDPRINQNNKGLFVINRIIILLQLNFSLPYTLSSFFF